MSYAVQRFSYIYSYNCVYKDGGIGEEGPKHMALYIIFKGFVVCLNLLLEQVGILHS